MKQLADLSLDALANRRDALQLELVHLAARLGELDTVAADAFARRDATAVTRAFADRDEALGRQAAAQAALEEVNAEGIARVQPLADQWAQRAQAQAAAWRERHEQVQRDALAALAAFDAAVTTLLASDATWQEAWATIAATLNEGQAQAKGFPAVWPAIEKPATISMRDVADALRVLMQRLAWEPIRLRPPLNI